MVFAFAVLALVADCSGTRQKTDEAGGVGPVSSPAPSPSPAVFDRLGYRFAVPEETSPRPRGCPWRYGSRSGRGSSAARGRHLVGARRRLLEYYESTP
jgi:hypothetical protein